jgi:membrane AbrB-like protein
MVPVSLGAGLSGGIAFNSIGIPLPYLLGSLCACALLSLNGWCAQLPRLGLRFGQMTIGLALGLYFTADVIGALVGILGWILFSGVLSLLLSFAGALFLQHRTGLDANTCFFSAVIGGASDMANQAAHAGGRGDLVALAHTIRVSMVVSIAPFLAITFSEFGLNRSNSLAILTTHSLDATANLQLLLAGITTALLAQRVRLPNPWVLGPILAGGFFALMIQEGQLSSLLLNLGQVLLGWNLGQRFSMSAIQQAPILSLNVAFLTLAYGLLGLGMALLAHWGAGLGWASSFIATTPGGIAEMALTAKLLGLESPAVTAFHVVRLVIVVISSQYLISLCLKQGWLVHNPKEIGKNGEQPSP